MYKIKKKIKESGIPKIPSVKLTDGKISTKNQEKIYLYLVYNNDSLNKIAGKVKPLSWKIGWTWTCSEIFRKFSYWENVLLFWMMLNK